MAFAQGVEQPYLQDRTISNAAGSGTVWANTVFETNGVGRSTEGSPSPAWDAREWNGSATKAAGWGDNWEIRADLLSGTTPTSGPALGSWHSLSTARNWANSQTGNGIKVSELSISLRPKGSTNPEVTVAATHTIRAEIF